jgi:tRNA 2-thiouridine synthesizing protein A
MEESVVKIGAEADTAIGEEPMLKLDLRGVACPMNFVKTRLKLDKMATGELLEVLLDSGEPIESVTSSVISEGHLIESSTLISPQGEEQMLSAEQSDYHCLIIRKTSAA